jgi:FkbM family methyltransferase
LERILELCRGASSFVDVGAEFGQFTLAVSASLAPHGRVVAVEPNPQNYLDGRTNVYPILAAAAECDRFLRLLPETRGNAGSTTTQYDIRRGEMILPALPLAEMLVRLNVEAIDVMKVDVEGFEPHVLRGLFDRRGPFPRNIFFEYLPQSFTTCDETVSLIRAAGYSIRQVNGEPFEPPMKPLENNLWASLPSQS